MSRFTACTLDCPDTCSLLAEAPGGRLKVRGNPDHPFTRGFTCSKVHRHIKRAFGPERITEPQLREGEGFRPVSWDTALDWAAERIQALRHRPEAMLHLRGHGYRGVLARASTAFFGRLGASALRGSLCDEAGIAAQVQDFGELDHNDPDDLLQARRIVLFGRDLPACSIHTHALVREARKGGAQVLCVSPGADNNGELVDERILIRPGTDRFLAAAAVKTLLERDRIPGRALEAAGNLEGFLEVLEGWSATELCAAAGLGREAAELLAKWYEGAAPTATLIAWGLQRYEHGAENVRFIDALCALSGQIGRPGAGAYFNIASSRNLGPWPGDAGRPSRELSYPRLAEELERADPPVEFIWADGGNPVNQVPDAQRMARAFEAVPARIVVDAFFTDTALRADLVLPPALMFEREEVLGSCLHNFVNYSAKVVEPPGSSRSDLDILRDLGRRLDPPLELPDSETALRAGLDSPWLETDLERMRREGWVRAKRGLVAFPNLRFAHPDGKCRLPEALNPEPAAEPGFPLRLLSLIQRRHLHSQIPVAEQEGRPEAAVSPDNPCLPGLQGARDVHLATPLGRMPVRLVERKGLHPEVVVYPRDDWMACGRGVNRLIRSRVSDAGETAAYYQQGARIEL